MKKVSLLFMCLLLCSGIAFAQQKPEAEFKKTEHNFGNIKEEIGDVTTQFEFTNKGDSPLIIHRVSSSCGCTTPFIPGSLSCRVKLVASQPAIPPWAAPGALTRAYGFIPTFPIRSTCLPSKGA